MDSQSANHSDREGLYIRLWDVPALTGRSYATIRKWASRQGSSAPLLTKIRQDPRNRRMVLVDVRVVAGLHGTEPRRGWHRKTIESKGETITVIEPDSAA